ncbi:hypothetical protein E5288_WYG019364 [Bos mutus]|uniref:Uncharacterized protein n=1 Tax=Bos mutus TaxID=72004 RepID=A0A6B0RFU9_9CETA|nr:hypothetical protein [Bos mutus]
MSTSEDRWIGNTEESESENSREGFQHCTLTGSIKREHQLFQGIIYPHEFTAISLPHTDRARTPESKSLWPNCRTWWWSQQRAFAAAEREIAKPNNNSNEKHFFTATTSLHLDRGFHKMIIWLRQEGHHTRPESQSRYRNSSQAFTDNGTLLPVGKSRPYIMWYFLAIFDENYSLLLMTQGLSLGIVTHRATLPVWILTDA